VNSLKGESIICNCKKIKTWFFKERNVSLNFFVGIIKAIRQNLASGRKEVNILEDANSTSSDLIGPISKKM